MKAKTFAGMIVLSLIFSLLAGCNSTAPGTPTTDPKMVFTEVVKSVQAQATADAQLTVKPSSTPQPTQTLAPSSTVPPTATKVNLTAGTRTVTVAGTAATNTSKTSAATLPAEATATLAAGGVPAVPDKMAWVSQSPADNAVLGRGENFTMVWTLKNTGTTTWTTKYWVRLYGGERLETTDFNLKDTVKPNETVKISVTMVAPSNPGKYNTWWVLSTPELANFGSFNFAFEVK